MFGDFEAQRHWMELTINLPINEWLENNKNKFFLSLIFQVSKFIFK
jgi:alpha-1,3-glucosyltransferase